MRTNLKVQRAPVFTHEGAPAIEGAPLAQLKRTVMACMLWEKGFYEDGEAVADRIKRLVPLCKPHEVAALAVEAREKQRLRHVPLLLVRELARQSKRFSVRETLERVIQRADEPGEFLSMYWAEDKAKDARARSPLANGVKKGLAAALRKFDEYQLAKYNGPAAVRLRDVLFFTHAKPADDAQAALWKKLAADELATPDTWEVALSAGADKKATFERLIGEGKLGYMALLRNLRNMHTAGVQLQTVAPALIAGAAKSKALPFRYIAAAKAVPQWEPTIDEAMQKALSGLETLDGSTTILIDVSGSMDAKLSEKSELMRLDAACGLAILLRGICKEVNVCTFSNALVTVAPRQGMALRDAICMSQQHAGTYLGAAVAKAPPADRLIVFTDEQSHDAVGVPTSTRGYMVNVATSQHGVGHSQWERINGFSEAIVDYIRTLEAQQVLTATA